MGVIVARAPWQHGRALSFDGQDDYVQLSGELMYAAGTVEAWIYLEQLASEVGYQTFFQNFLYQHNSNNCLYLEGGAMLFLPAFPKQQWRHLAVTWTDKNDSATAYAYFNGVLASRSQVSSYGLQGISGLARHSAGQYTKGVFDGVVIYDRALSAGEIRNNYLSKKPVNPSGLVLWLKMDEAFGNKVWDYSGQSNHGTIYGATRVSGLVPAG